MLSSTECYDKLVLRSFSVDIRSVTQTWLLLQLLPRWPNSEQDPQKAGSEDDRALQVSEEQGGFTFLIKIFPWNTITDVGDCGLETPRIMRCDFRLPASRDLGGDKNWGNVGSQFSKLTWLIVSTVSTHFNAVISSISTTSSSLTWPYQGGLHLIFPRKKLG